MALPTLILISGNEGNTLIIQDYLRRGHYEPARVYNTLEDALAFFDLLSAGASPNSGIDLIICDQSQSPDDAISTVVAIHSHLRVRHIPILVITPYEQPGQLAAILMSGAADCISYPVNAAELMARIYKALQLKTEADRCIERESELERLLDAERLQMAALQTLANGILILNPELVITWSNPALYRIIAMTDEQLIGQPIFDISLTAQFTGWDTAFWAALPLNSIWRRDLIIVNGEGREFIAETTIMAVANAQDQLSNYIISLHDITERESARLQMLNDLKMAHQLQMISLPEDIEEADFSACGLYYPAHILGGDLYFWEEVDDGFYAVILLDMVGHGVSSALMSVYTRAIIPGFMKRYRSPSEIIRHLDHIVSRLNEAGQFDIYYYATAVLAVLDFKTNRLHYVNAGHPAGLALSRSGAQLEMIEGCPPIGMIGKREIHEGCMEIKDIDRFVLYSDGLFELLSANPGQKLIAAIEELIVPEDKDGAGLFKAVQDAFSKRQHLNDDVSLVQVRFK